MDIHTKEFDGSCETCGGLAAVFPRQGTAVIQRQDTKELSVVALDRVTCERRHEYAVIAWDSQVDDPFPDGYAPEEEQ